MWTSDVPGISSIKMCLLWMEPGLHTSSCTMYHLLVHMYMYVYSMHREKTLLNVTIKKQRLYPKIFDNVLYFWYLWFVCARLKALEQASFRKHLAFLLAPLCLLVNLRYFIFWKIGVSVHVIMLNWPVLCVGACREFFLSRVNSRFLISCSVPLVIVRPYCMHHRCDLCVFLQTSLCLCVLGTSEPCKNGWIDPDSTCCLRADSGVTKKPLFLGVHMARNAQCAAVM